MHGPIEFDSDFDKNITSAFEKVMQKPYDQCVTRDWVKFIKENVYKLKNNTLEYMLSEDCHTGWSTCIIIATKRELENRAFEKAFGLKK